MQPSSSEGYSKSMVIYTICRCLVIVLAFWLVYRSTLDFLNSAVDSSIDSIDVPLSEVYFPSVTICNINQVSMCLKYMPKSSAIQLQPIYFLFSIKHDDDI